MLMAGEGVAFAASGTVRGYWKFQQYAGGYCTEGSFPGACDGARYLEAQHATAQPMRWARLYVQDQNGADIGQCSTSNTGYYSCAWSRSTVPTQLKVTFRFEEKNQRFRITYPDGVGGYYWTTAWQTGWVDGENRYIGTLTIRRWGSHSSSTRPRACGSIRWPARR
jgi:hypothetical protein